MPTLDLYNGYALWEYIPNRPAAIVFTILFSLLTAYHAYLMFRHRLWFCIPFIIGGICKSSVSPTGHSRPLNKIFPVEIIGYIGRILAYDATGELIPYILQSVLLLLAPIFFAATLYMTLGRVIITVAGQHLSLIPPRWLTRTFVTADVVSFLIQGGGAGILVQASSEDKSQLGRNVIVGGLAFQLVAFGIFCVTALLFDLRFRKHGLTQSNGPVPWRSILVVLYVTSAFIMIRNVFRAVEYAAGQTGYLLAHEWPTYVFDGLLMLLTMMALAWKYPSQLLTSKHTDADMEMGQAR